MSRQRVPQKVVEAAIHALKERFKGAEMAAEMEGRKSQYEALMLYIDEISDLILQINEDGNAMDESSFSESLAGIKLVLLTTIQAVSLGPNMLSDLASQFNQITMGAEKSFIDAAKSGKEAKVIAFQEHDKRFYMPEGIPDEVMEGFKRVEERIKDKDVTPEMVAKIVHEELGHIAQLTQVSEHRDTMELKKSTNKGNGTIH